MKEEEDIRKRNAFNKYLGLVKKDIKHFFSDYSSFVTISCPACDSKQHTKEFEKERFTYVSCRKCGTLFANPRPDFKTLNQFYNKSPSGDFWAKHFFAPVAEARRKFIFRPRADYITKAFPRCRNGVIGDIGAGLGIFSEELAKQWPQAQVIAIEPSEEMASTCREKGLQVIPCALEEIKDMDSRFDLLCSFELMEHVYSPAEFISHVHRLLKPGGLWYFTTLNGEGFDIQVLWEKSKSIFPPQHLNFFNPDSAKHLLESHGFRIKETATPGVLDWDIVEKMYTQEKINPGRFWQLIAQKADSKTKKHLQRWISENGFSSHMRIVARKV